MAKAPTTAPSAEVSEHNPDRAKQLTMGQGAPTPQPTEEKTDGEADQPESEVEPVSESDGPSA